MHKWRVRLPKTPYYASLLPSASNRSYLPHAEPQRAFARQAGASPARAEPRQRRARPRRQGAKAVGFSRGEPYGLFLRWAVRAFCCADIAGFRSLVVTGGDGALSAGAAEIPLPLPTGAVGAVVVSEVDLPQPDRRPANKRQIKAVQRTGFSFFFMGCKCLLLRKPLIPAPC